MLDLIYFCGQFSQSHSTSIEYWKTMRLFWKELLSENQCNIFKFSVGNRIIRLIGLIFVANQMKFIVNMYLSSK